MDDTFFVSSASPGAVLRFLERRAAQDGELAETVVLSDGVGSQHWRVLASLGEGSLLHLAPQLALAFPPTLYWLDLHSGRWRAWHADGGEETGQEPPGKRLLWRRPTPPGKAWATARALPWERAANPPATIDYLTVAQLDQKGKLVESTPRLYRFPLREVQ